MMSLKMAPRAHVFDPTSEETDASVLASDGVTAAPTRYIDTWPFIGAVTATGRTNRGAPMGIRRQTLRRNGNRR
jgi:hypothetical protein